MERVWNAADVYVFAVLAEKDRKKIDPQDIRQWFFIVLPSRIINSKFGRRKTAVLSTLEKLDVRRLGFEELKAAIENC